MGLDFYEFLASCKKLEKSEKCRINQGDNESFWGGCFDLNQVALLLSPLVFGRIPKYFDTAVWTFTGGGS